MTSSCIYLPITIKIKLWTKSQMKAVPLINSFAIGTTNIYFYQFWYQIWSFNWNLNFQQDDTLLSELWVVFVNMLSWDSSNVYELVCEIYHSSRFCKWDGSFGFTWLQETDNSRPTSNHEQMEWLHTFLQLDRCYM